jgi:transketolase
MRIPLSWLSAGCGRDLSMPEVAGWVTEAGAVATVATSAEGADLLELSENGTPSHLMSVDGILRHLRARLDLPHPRRPVVPRPRGSLDVRVDPGAEARLDAVLVRVPGPVRLPAAEQGWLRDVGYEPQGSVLDVITLVRLEMGHPAAAADGGPVSSAPLSLEHLRRPLRIANPSPEGCGQTLPPDCPVLTVGDTVLAALELACPLRPPRISSPGTTTETLVYAWWFAPETLRRLRSLTAPDRDASAGLCGAHPASCGEVVARICELLRCWGAADVVAAGGAGLPPPSPRTMLVSVAEAAILLGECLDAARLRTLLERVGLPVVQQGVDEVLVEIPPQRPDLETPGNVLGEVVVVRGAAVRRRLPVNAGRPGESPARRRRQMLVDAAVRRGLQEIRTPVLLPADVPGVLATARSSGLPPLHGRRGLRHLRARASLLPGVLEAAARSVLRTGAAGVFEIGQVPRSAEPGDEAWRFTAALAGPVLPPSLLDRQPRTVQLEDVAGLAQWLCAEVDLEVPRLVPGPHDDAVIGWSFDVRIGEVTVGSVARLNRAAATGLGVPDAEIYWLDLDPTAGHGRGRPQVVVPPRFTTGFYVTVLPPADTPWDEVRCSIARTIGVPAAAVCLRDHRREACADRVCGRRSGHGGRSTRTAAPSGPGRVRGAGVAGPVSTGAIPGPLLSGRFSATVAAAIAAGARERILRTALERPVHLGASLSVIDVLAVLYGGWLRRHPDHPQWDERDRLVLSKGHAAFALYAVLAQVGMLHSPLTELPSHPADGIPGIEVGTGALGHGLSIGCGMAVGARLAGRGYRICVVLGDGELGEGSNWEAALFAAHHRLGNLVAIVDRNCLQQEGRTEDILALEPLVDKWRAFGWRVERADGHDPFEIARSLDRLVQGAGPGVLLASTTKGRGVSFMESDPAWHHRQLDAGQYRRALAEVTGREDAS